MPNINGNSIESDGPEGSIFLPEPLSERGYQNGYLALLMGRGAFAGLDLEEAEAQHRMLEFRRRLTKNWLERQ